MLKKKPTRFKKVIGKIHLWLGLSSGLIVFIIAVTGCLYAFQNEIQNLTQPYRFTAAASKPHLAPSVLKDIATKKLPGKKVHGVMYNEPGRSAMVIFYSYDPSYYYLVYMNPYTGEVLKVKDENADFFRMVLDGHFYLWLPPKIGQPIAASATLVFLVMLVSGLILWWPRNKGARKQRFSIKWSARWRRKNYDLHNVLGFYATWIAIILAVTGLVWGFQWFAQGLYTVAGGEKQLQYVEPHSDTTYMAVAGMPAMDRVWLRMKKEHPHAKGLEVHVPETAASSIAVSINPDDGTYWQTDYRYFDQYTLKELPVSSIYGRFHEASAADKLLRMNYDIHVGAVLGLPGKILAFFISLICASLPVTGFYIWWGRRVKKAGVHEEEAPLRSAPPMKRPASISVKAAGARA